MSDHISRRSLFGFLPGLAALAVPEVAAAEKPEDKLDQARPIILEHVCDHGASRYDPKELAEIQKEAPWIGVGCGTRFQWHWGTASICPNCGYHYLVTLEDLKNNFYKRVEVKHG